MTNVLVVDGERATRNTLKERLEYEGYRVDLAATDAEATQRNTQGRYDLMLYGVEQPGLEANPFLASIQGMPHPPVILLSALKGIDPVVKAMRDGAYDYIPKPINLNKLLESMRAAVTTPSQNRAATALVAPQREVFTHGATLSAVPFADEQLVGNSQAMQHVQRLIAKVAPSEARVLIMGANGTGKELVAHRLHAQSRRAAAPFIEVNCAAIPSELIESELFGHEKGSFTSANRQHRGKFEQADGGTLFLDEIGDMSLSAQAKVLRALQENRISRVGGDCDITVDVRVVAATNKDLCREIEAGNFREDLYHRLSVIIIRVPPLCDRADDIPPLATHFINRICQEYGIAPKTIRPEALERLQTMPWRGNIRELRNVIERLIILSDGDITEQEVACYAQGAL